MFNDWTYPSFSVKVGETTCQKSEVKYYTTVMTTCFTESPNKIRKFQNKLYHRWENHLTDWVVTYLLTYLLMYWVLSSYIIENKPPRKSTTVLLYIGQKGY